MPATYQRTGWLTAAVSQAERRLREDPRCRGIVLFGSAARGDYADHSDVDLLIVHDDLVPEDLLDDLDPRISPSFYDRARLSRLQRQSPLFANHLAREGKVLHDLDGAISRTLADVRDLRCEDANAIALKTQRRLHHVLADPEFKPGDLSSLGELYALAKQSALLVSAERREYEFGRSRAFGELMHTKSFLRKDVEKAQRLEPAWLSMRTNLDDTLDLGAEADDLVASAVRVIRLSTDVGG